MHCMAILPKFKQNREYRPYITQHKGNENTQTYQVEVVILIQYHILVTYLQGNVKQLEGRINNQILGVKGLNISQ